MSRPYQQQQQQQQQRQQHAPDNSSNYNNKRNSTIQQSFPTDGVAKESDPLLASGPRRNQNSNNSQTTTTLRSRRRPGSRSPEVIGTGHHLTTTARNSTLLPLLPVVHYLDKKDRPMIPTTTITHSTDIDPTQQPPGANYYPPPENDWGVRDEGERVGSFGVGDVHESIVEEAKEEIGGNDCDSTTSSMKSARLSVPQQQTPLPPGILNNEMTRKGNEDVDDEEFTSINNVPQRDQVRHHHHHHEEQHQPTSSQSDHSVSGKSQSTPPPMYNTNKINYDNEILHKNVRQQSTYATPTTDNYNNYNTIDDPYNSIRLSQHEYVGAGIVGTDNRSVGSGGSEQPPLLEIPEEIYAVRKAALQVLKPLNMFGINIRKIT